MVISRQGIDVTGTGMTAWEMHHEWSEVEGYEVFTPDEARFMFNAKLDKASSVIQVTLVNGEELRFEVRGAPAANLRTSLGSVIAMGRGLKRWRVVREQR